MQGFITSQGDDYDDDDNNDDDDGDNNDDDDNDNNDDDDNKDGDLFLIPFLHMQSDGQFNIFPNELDFPAQLRQNQVKNVLTIDATECNAIHLNRLQ